MACRRPFLLRFNWPRTILSAVLGSHLLYVLLGAVPAHALDPNKHLTQYIHTTWRTQDGSAPAGMLSIAQTSDGFLWYSAIAQGVYRFDGVRFLRRSPNTKMGSIDIGNLVADRTGGLWVIGDHEIAHVKDGAVITHLELDGIGGHAGTSLDADGSLWIVRASNRVADAPLCHVTDLAAKCFGKSEGVPISPADALLADGQGGFWVGGQTALVHWRAGVSQVYPIQALKSNTGDVGINGVVRDADGRLWVGIAAAGPGLGLGQFKDGVFRPFVTSSFDGSKVSIYDMLLDRDGNLWVATLGKGLLRIRGNVVEHYGRTEGLSSDSVSALFEDREGIVWAATTNGVDSFRDPRIVTFSALEGLGKDAAAGVMASHDGTIWIANSGSLDRIVNGTVSSIRGETGLPGHQVASMLQDHAGNMWVGVDDGLYLLRAGRFQRIPEPGHQPIGMVVGMTEDIDGNIWAECAGNPRKLVRIRDFQVVEEFTSSQVPAGHTLAPDPQGGIWIGTLKGDLIRFRQGAVQNFPLHTKGATVSHQIVADSDGLVLAASDEGLVGLRQDTVQRMTKKNGLPCDSVISFTKDNLKRWWLYAACGVVEVPDPELQRWWLNPDSVVQTRVYDVLDGALPNQPSFNSAADSPDGRVWFATGFVVQMIDPSKLSQKVPPADTYIESVIVDRNEVAATYDLKLPPHPRELQIDYTSPTFAIPQKVKFRYRLDGYDHDWHDAGTRRQAFYTDLPPGKYSFRVMASNGDGVWNDNSAKLDFSVTPANYQTNWFRALCALMCLLLLWALYQLRVRQLAAQFNMRLEERVSERTRIARDLHDTLLQSFQGLLPRFQAAIYKLPPNAVDARETLEAAVDQASHAITEGRDAVQGLRASIVEKNDLAMAIRRVTEELASADTHQSAPAFQVAVQGTPRNLHPILRDEVYRIAAEALRNAFRHAGARQIEVEIQYDEREFSLHVRDDGKGIDPSVLSGDGREGHYGLHSMRERANLVGGELAIWSEVDSGTEVELSIPALRAYSKSARRFWFFEKLSKNTDAKEKIES
jgi:signal transduction histidine kinase/ligand-binding sensor domain-containing protein